MKTAGRVGCAALAVVVALLWARAASSGSGTIARSGTTYWSDAGLHQVRNVGTTESHTIRIELKH